MITVTAADKLHAWDRKYPILELMTPGGIPFDGMATVCWNWDGQLSGDGCPMVKDRDGKQKRVNRMVNGLTERHIQTNPICGNYRCVRPDHIEILTASELKRRSYDNNDTSQKGEQHHNSKLTDDQVFEIYVRAHNGETAASLSKEYNGYHAGNISHIKDGRSHHRLTCHGKLSAEQIIAVYKSELPTETLTELYDVNTRVVNAIKAGRLWGHITHHGGQGEL